MVVIQEYGVPTGLLISGIPAEGCQQVAVEIRVIRVNTLIEHGNTNTFSGVFRPHRQGIDSDIGVEIPLQRQVNIGWDLVRCIIIDDKADSAALLSKGGPYGTGQGDGDRLSGLEQVVSNDRDTKTYSGLPGSKCEGGALSYIVRRGCRGVCCTRGSLHRDGVTCCGTQTYREHQLGAGIIRLKDNRDLRDRHNGRVGHTQRVGACGGISASAHQCIVVTRYARGKRQHRVITWPAIVIEQKNLATGIQQFNKGVGQRGATCTEEIGVTREEVDGVDIDVTGEQQTSRCTLTRCNGVHNRRLVDDQRILAGPGEERALRIHKVCSGY